MTEASRSHSSMSEPQNIIAVVYDFDHTLSPQYMQDQTILPHAGIEPQEFWQSCTALIKEKGYDQELAYMKRMLEHDAIRTLSNRDLQGMGAQLTFFPGIPDCFGELNAIIQQPKYQEWGHPLGTLRGQLGAGSDSGRQ